MDDMSVESTNKSLVVQGGNSLQPSARAVAPRSTQTDYELSKKQLIVLVELFKSLLENTYSPDVRSLSVGAAVHNCKAFMDEKEALAIAKKLMSIRRGNIMDSMF